MRGWQFTETGNDLQFIEKDDPKISSDEVLIDVKAAGLCHTDVGILHDPSWAPLISAPVILGHENAGVITQVGANVTDFKPGDRVAVSPQNPVTGQTIGAFRDGGYADKLIAPSVQLVPLPASVSFTQGASATDAGMSAYHPLFIVGQATKNTKVGIIGIGGLGQFATNMAVITGCEVYVVDTKSSSLEWAKKIGVNGAYSSIAELAPLNLDLIIDFAGFDTTTNEAVKAVKPGGTVILVGMGIMHTTIDSGSLITKNISLVGNSGGTPDDIANVLKFFETGKMEPQLETTSFNDIPEGLKRVESGDVSGRLIASRA